jgi:uncharacterized membrane protein
MRTLKTLALILCLSLASVIATPQAAAAARAGYRIVDLGAIAGFPPSDAYAVNDSGQIAGASIDPVANVWRATIWIPSGTTWVPRDIGTLPGMPSSFATDISGTGLVVATADTPTGMTTRRAFVWSGGDPVPLTTQPSEAWGVNFAGTQVAGMIRTDTSHHAVAWSLVDGVWSMAALPELPDAASSEAVGVSDTGLLVGSASTAGSINPYVVIWAKDATGAWTITQLPSLPGASFTKASRIDRRMGTQITGESGSRASRHAVLWTRTGTGSAWAIRDLGALPHHCCSNGSDVNASGQVVGTSEAAGSLGYPDSSTSTAFIRTLANGMHALGSLANRSSAGGINGTGLIVGSSAVTRDPMSAIHAVAWTK